MSGTRKDDDEMPEVAEVLFYEVFGAFIVSLQCDFTCGSPWYIMFE